MTNPFALYVREYDEHTRAKHTALAIKLQKCEDWPDFVVGFRAEDPVVVV
ncbi:hypothetical protein SAMN04488133_1987 [Halobellus limi]|uniref:Uncharacterized protein n=1 Tax=Halobellus limi TaxID=699433 RepID=A0A1H5ZGE8_9EURY|nr:hypothetical protein SAMN04488133_1987 [Halobellus limi]